MRQSPAFAVFDMVLPKSALVNLKRATYWGVKRLMLLHLFFALCSLPSRASTQCPDLLMTPADLEGILDLTLGSLRPFVRDRSVVIDSTLTSCYVQMRVAVAALPGVECELHACSAATFHGQYIGLNAFDVDGCDAMFNLFSDTRHVPAALADARTRIQDHCGSPDFEIAEVRPIRTSSGTYIRVRLRAVAPGRRL